MSGVYWLYSHAHARAHRESDFWISSQPMGKMPSSLPVDHTRELCIPIQSRQGHAGLLF